MNFIECTVVDCVVVSGVCAFCFDRKFCTALIYGAIFWLVFFWTVPVGFISSLIALQNLAKVVPFLEPGKTIGNFGLGYEYEIEDEYDFRISIQ